MRILMELSSGTVRKGATKPEDNAVAEISNQLVILGNSVCIIYDSGNGVGDLIKLKYDGSKFYIAELTKTHIPRYGQLKLPNSYEKFYSDVKAWLAPVGTTFVMLKMFETVSFVLVSDRSAGYFEILQSEYVQSSAPYTRLKPLVVDYDRSPKGTGDFVLPTSVIGYLRFG